MKTTELRLGNLVYDRSGKLLRIDWWENINKVCMDMNIGGTQVHPLTEYPEFCKPIPLTEEWLLKFGFFKNDDLFYIGEIGLYLDGNIWWNKELINGDCEYIHQLQNLYFALTGKELSY